MQKRAKTLKRLGILACYAGLLSLGYSNCGRAGFDATVGGTDLSSIQKSCEEIILKTYEKTYYPLLSNNCFQCHSDSHGSKNLAISFQAFQQKGISQIHARATTPHGGNNINLTQEISQASSAWSAGQAEYNQCVSSSTPTVLNEKSAFGEAGLKRLTRTEVLNSLKDIFAVDPSTDIELLPEDFGGSTYFSNDYSGQYTTDQTAPLYADFAEAYSVRLAGTANMVRNIAGCTPTSSADQTCFAAFASKVGRKLLRRKLQDAEIKRLSAVMFNYSRSENRFLTSIELLLQYFLQNPEFLYRLEGGKAMVEPGTVELTDYEIASRMSFLIWGSVPDDELMNLAELGTLSDSIIRKTQAERMLADPRAKRRTNQFHGEWLGYAENNMPAALKADLLQETDKLIERVVFDLNRNWADVFNWNETYLTPALAQHYGMPAMTSSKWVTYSGDRGGGLFSHGAFMSLGAKFGDTSPTRRGYEIFKRVLCGRLGPIPPGVDPDFAPGNPTDCKEKRYNMRSISTCASCHNITDDIGFGLENVGPFGNWRDVEPGNPNCGIAGTGSVNNSPFKGPKAFGEIVSKNPQVYSCMATQYFRFMTGRMNTLEDTRVISAMGNQLSTSPQLKNFITSLVSADSFRYRAGVK